ncbi:MAG: acyl-CoA dehydrogenase family protein [Woeseiaceae bacterium]|jgi:alkylation response protein AidB-like acyl-CoA dehydrogenase|nr:acyl-CoA dehydrogenase family protein [Woeseiaceae bacterium]
MDFALSEEQLMLEDSVEKFIANDYDFDTRQKYAGSDRGYSRDVWQQFAELGWTAVPFSEEDGGFGWGPVEIMLIMRQFGRGLVVEPYLANIVLAGGVLRRLADAAQKADWLAPVIGGEAQAALAHVEPQSRYELASVATTATADGDDYLLSGRKGVTLNGGNADFLVVSARTAGATTDPEGISLFVVPADAAGLSRRAYPTVDGHQAAEIDLEDVRVPAANRLGPDGQALETIVAVTNEATLAVCAEAVGIMQIMTHKTVDYSKSRVQFGVPIGSFQALQHRMVDMLTACEQSYSLLLWATMLAAEDASSEEAQRAVSSIKYQVGTAGKKVGQEAVQIHGGMGVTWELDIAHYFKRLTVIGQLFGNADYHLDRLAA